MDKINVFEEPNRIGNQKPIEYIIKDRCWICISHNCKGKYCTIKRSKLSQFKKGYNPPPQKKNNKTKVGAFGLHRYIFFLKEGYYPEVVMHICDNPKCINPSHLIGGITRDNVKDKVNKGRHCFGLKNKGGGENQKIDDELARKIKIDLKDKIPTRKIAKKYVVSRNSVCRIKRGTHWKHIKI